MLAAYNARSQDQGLVYLANRKTYIEWDKVLMGPVNDQRGVEQGGCLSDRLHNLASALQLLTTQASGLGIDMAGVVHVASIGQADNVALISQDLHKLKFLLQLVVNFAATHHTTLVPEKTKLLCYSPSARTLVTSYWSAAAPIQLGDLTIHPTNQAEHVGIVRSPESGATASLVARLSAHTRALYSTLPAGLARGHYGNPAAALRVERMFGAPVLLSGLASLVLSTADFRALDHHHKVTLEKLQRLYPATPEPVVYFLAGSLPASALLHMKMFSLVAMLGHLGPDNILTKFGTNILLAPPSCRSWFCRVAELAELYGLPSPLSILTSPPSKPSWKRTVRAAMTNHWETKLRQQASKLESLTLCQTQYMSLVKPHPVWTSAGASSYEVEKATVQARVISGRFRSDWLRRHWSGDPTGLCQVCLSAPGTLTHQLTGQCPGLSSATLHAVEQWFQLLAVNPILIPVISSLACSSPDTFLSFLADPSSSPAITNYSSRIIIIIYKGCILSFTMLSSYTKSRCSFTSKITIRVKKHYIE